MSFAVTRDRGLYEWAGTSLGALFAQRRNIINPGQWRMVWDILRFNSASLKELKQGDKGESIGDFIRREGYSDSFRDNYLLVRFVFFSCQ
jgi:predicted NAD/FAD-binding protein